MKLNLKKYEISAKKLDLKFAGIRWTTEYGEVLLFQHNFGSFILIPGETLEEAFKRAKHKAEKEQKNAKNTFKI